MSIFDIVRFFLRPSAEAEDIQLTHTGKDNQIYNGIPDWVNEEEVLEDNKQFGGRLMVASCFMESSMILVLT